MHLWDSSFEAVGIAWEYPHRARDYPRLAQLLPVRFGRIRRANLEPNFPKANRHVRHTPTRDGALDYHPTLFAKTELRSPGFTSLLPSSLTRAVFPMMA